MPIPLPNLLKDPPPAYAFELSEAGVAFARTAAPEQIEFHDLEPGVLSISPVRDNLHQPEVLSARISAISPPNGNRKRRAALILPDYSARIAVLDFDSFPADPGEQVTLIRFRMKKSVPFDIESAMVGYHAQPLAGTNRQIEVVVAVMAQEIVSRYESPFRAAGFLPGFVTTSGLAALSLLAPDAVTMVAKLTGRALTVMVLDHNVLKLFRCVELGDITADEIESVLHPTVAYVEDELQSRPKRLLLCGLGPLGEHMTALWQSEWGVGVETLRSRFGAVGPTNAGLLGYLESLHA